MVDDVAGQGELGGFGRSTTHAADGWRVICRHIVGVLKTQLGTEGYRTSQPEIEPYQMLAVPGLAPSALPLEVVDELIADSQRAVVMIELVLDVVDDGIVWCETMGCQRIALRSIGPTIREGLVISPALAPILALEP